MLRILIVCLGIPTAWLAQIAVFGLMFYASSVHLEEEFGRCDPIEKKSCIGIGVVKKSNLEKPGA